jgi:hypothetical protein
LVFIATIKFQTEVYYLFCPFYGDPKSGEEPFFIIQTTGIYTVIIFGTGNIVLIARLLMTKDASFMSFGASSLAGIGATQ